jgi:hypothetical protein
MRNVIDDPAYRDTALELKTELTRLRREANDTQ